MPKKFNSKKMWEYIMGQEQEHHNSPINRSHIQEALREQGFEYNQETKTIEEINDEDHVNDGLETALHILEKTYGKVQGYQTDDGMLEHQRAITALKKLCEQKPIEWTDDDEYIRNSILHTLDIKKCLSEKNGDAEAAKKWHTYYNWFKTRCPKNS